MQKRQGAPSLAAKIQRSFQMTYSEIAKLDHVNDRDWKVMSCPISGIENGLPDFHFE